MNLQESLASAFGCREFLWPMERQNNASCHGCFIVFCKKCVFDTMNVSNKYATRNSREPLFSLSQRWTLRGAFTKKMSQIVEKVHNFFGPPPQDNVDYFEFGKKMIFDDPPLGPNLGKNWNVDYFEIFVPPLILAKTGPKLFDPCKNSTKSYLTVTMGLFPSNISHICTKFCLYLTFISPMNYQIPDHISVIWIWEKFENPDPPLVSK